MIVLATIDSYVLRHLQLTNTHQYGFRCGETAKVIELVNYNGTPCWRIRYEDDVEDFVVVRDNDHYKLTWKN